MSFADHLAADRRRWILRILAEDGGHSSETTIESTLAALGHHAGLDREYVREQLRFLETADCITVELYRDKLMVASITARGVAVLEGRKTCDGIAARKLGESTTLSG
jgi:hypothetical protein